MFVIQVEPRNMVIVGKAIDIIKERYARGLEALMLSNITKRYLVQGNPDSIGPIVVDINSKLSNFFTGGPVIVIVEKLFKPKIIGERIGSVIYINSFFLETITDDDLPRLVENLSHELMHIFGYQHPSSFLFKDTSNIITRDKALHSIPYRFGFLMGALYYFPNTPLDQINKIADKKALTNRYF